MKSKVGSPLKRVRPDSRGFERTLGRFIIFVLVVLVLKYSTLTDQALELFRSFAVFLFV